MTNATLETVARVTPRGPAPFAQGRYFPQYGDYVRAVMNESGKWDGDDNAVRIQKAVKVALGCLAEAEGFRRPRKAGRFAVLTLAAFSFVTIASGCAEPLAPCAVGIDLSAGEVSSLTPDSATVQLARGRATVPLASLPTVQVGDSVTLPVLVNTCEPVQ